MSPQQQSGVAAEGPPKPDVPNFMQPVRRRERREKKATDENAPDYSNRPRSIKPTKKLTTIKSVVQAMPKYQLKYLNLRGKAEPIRLLFNFVQEPFEDHRENFVEFGKRKDRLPLVRLPLLVVDGRLDIPYTSCILAHLGRQFGLEAEKAEERTQCEVLAQRLNDYHNQLKPWVYTLMGIMPAENLQTLTQTVFVNTAVKDFAAVFEKQLETNNTGYLVGDKLTWVDFYCAAFLDNCLTYAGPERFEKFRRLMYHRNAVFSLPQLQEYLKNRPETFY